MIGIVAHVEKPGAADAVKELLERLSESRAEWLLESRTAGLVGCESTLSIAEIARRCSILMVLGGDGTILRVVHQIHGSLPPIFGINIGSLGFLTCLGRNEIPQAVESVLSGNFVLSSRTLLRVETAGGEPLIFEGLNDVVMSRGERSQLIKIRAAIDSEILTEYHADGLIVATPTGSTAYSLSSGGPILMPDSGSFVITPICPHVLTNRSVVVGDRARITLMPSTQEQEIFVNVDGLDIHKIAATEHIIITKSQRILPLAMIPGRSFSDVLRQKLKWSGSNV
jgi:NAD+ kinase